jgi:hypothetical protein
MTQARLEEFKDRMSLVLYALPSTYRLAVKAANTPEQALAVGERIRDETLAAMDEIRRSLGLPAAAR